MLGELQGAPHLRGLPCELRGRACAPRDRPAPEPCILSFILAAAGISPRPAPGHALDPGSERDLAGSSLGIPGTMVRASQPVGSSGRLGLPGRGRGGRALRLPHWWDPGPPRKPGQTTPRRLGCPGWRGALGSARACPHRTGALGEREEARARGCAHRCLSLSPCQGLLLAGEAASPLARARHSIGVRGRLRWVVLPPLILPSQGFATENSLCRLQ
ncbi:hypothetical protein P7K49_003197 [Saguinus oedipus]|uniref:Uncharacterized protein n=1 Tax=Saguinus oedipus TaxID=9490 RepID=A0ABQ9WJH1_SAGOE|nr:hypothetical protein P7K49_003197 [Saguinus oedipus]